MHLWQKLFLKPRSQELSAFKILSAFEAEVLALTNLQ